jgi:hypothetical protein
MLLDNGYTTKRNWANFEVSADLKNIIKKP